VWRATIKGLIAHRVRLALTAMSIVLGVGFVAGTYILTDTMNRAFDNLFKQVTSGVAVQVSGIPKFKGGSSGMDAGPAERVPASLIPVVAKVPGVRVAEGALAGYAQLVAKDGKAVTTGGAPTLGVTATNDPQLSGVRARTGRPPQRAGEIGIDAHTARKYNFRIGDVVTVLLQGAPMRATITGIFGFGSADNLGGATLTVFDKQTGQTALNGRGKWDTIDVAAEPGVNAKDLRDRIQAVLPAGFQAKTGTQAAADTSSDIKKNLSFFSIALLVFAGIALFVGAFTIYNTFSILIAQRTRELGLLRALGASVKQVRRSVLAEALIVGIVASGVGLGFGFLIALGLQGLLRSFGIELPSTTNQLLPRTIIAAIVVGVVTTVVSSVVPAMRASRVPPVAAMRDTGPAEYEGSRRRVVVGSIVFAGGVAALLIGLFAVKGAAVVGLGAVVVFLGVAMLSPVFARPVSRALGAPLPKISGISGKLGRENAMRNPRRTASTAAALMIGLALIGFVSIFSASVKASASAAIERTLRADYAVIPSSFSNSTGFSQDVAKQLRATSKFSSVVEFRQGVLGYKGSARLVMATDSEHVSNVEDLELPSGTLAKLGEGDVLVRKTTADSEKWRIGQDIPVVFSRTGKQQLHIVGIVKANVVQSDFLVSLATYDRNFVSQLDAVVLVKTKPGTSEAAARAAADAIGKRFPNVKVQNQAELRDTQAKQLNMILGLITALLGLALIIALFGIVNTLALSIFERTREIGLLRAVGMARRQVRAMVRWEAMLIAVFGAILGIAVGGLFGWAMVSALGPQGIDRLAIPAGQLIGYVVFAGVAGVIAALGPARRAAKLNVLEAITTE